MTEEPNYCPTNLIPDIPADKDSFGGAHQRTAEALAQLLEKEVGGKTIGLEGGWGSGKSTVIELLKNIISNKNDYFMVVFDTWAHEDDPLRRVFLEELIRNLQYKKWLNNNKTDWNEELDILTNKIEITENETNQKLTPLGNFLSFLFLLIPIGIYLTNASLKFQGINILGILPLNSGNLFDIGILIILLPLIVLLLINLFPFFYNTPIYIQKTFYRLTKTKSKKFKAYKKYHKQLLSQHYDTITTNKKRTTSNLTSLEFEEKFKSLILDSELDDNKLILVLDNLDRIAFEEALSILSTLQTFLQYGQNPISDIDINKEFSKKLQNLWVVIPYDPLGLRKLWKKNNSVNNNEISTSMIEKRFQIVFRVPPLVLSNWKTNLFELLQKALEQHNEFEFYQVYEVIKSFSQINNKLNNAPTPRELKIIVNQIGAIHRQWNNHEIPLHHIAYFVLQTKNYPEIDLAKELIEDNIPDEKMEYILDKDVIKEHIAALWFNVDVSLAKQLLLKQILETALEIGDSDQIIEYIDQYQGFEEILASIEFNEWLRTKQRNWANAILAINRTKIFNNKTLNKNPHYAGVINKFQIAVKKTNFWDSFDSTMANGFSLLLEITQDQELAKNIVSKLSLSEQDSSLIYSSDQMAEWVEGWMILYKKIVSLNFDLQIIYQEKVSIPTNIASHFEAIHQFTLKDTESLTWDLIEHPITNQQITERLNLLIKDDTLLEYHYPIIKFSQEINLELNWSEILAELNTKLSTVENIKPNIVLISTQNLWLIRAINEKADSILKNLTNGGQFLHHLHNVRTEKEIRTIAWLIMLILKYDPQISDPPGHGQATPGGINYLVGLLSNQGDYDEVANEFINLLETHDEYNIIKLVLEKTKRDISWLGVCINKIIEQGNGNKIIDLDLEATHWEKLINNVGKQEFEILLKKLINETSFTNNISKQEFIPTHADFYSQIIQNDGAKGRSHIKFKTWCIKGLKDKIDETTWVNNFQSTGIILHMLLNCLDKFSTSLKLEAYYLNALNTFSETLMQGTGASTSIDIKKWKLLPLGLKTKLRTTFKYETLKSMKSKTGKIAKPFFDVFGEEVLDIKLIKNDRQVVADLFNPLLTEKSAHGLEWISNLFTKSPSFFDDYSHDKSSVETFRDRVQAEIDSDVNHAAFPQIKEIALKLGIVKSSPEIEDDEEIEK